MEVTFLGATSAIGGNKFLLVDGKDPGSRLLLDFGMQFGDPASYAKAGGGLGAVGAFYDEFLQPRANAGLRDLVRLGVLPAVDGLYRDDWLVTSGFERMVEDHLGSLPLRAFWESGLESYEAYQARTGRPFVDGILLSHAHADHFQHIAFVDPRIPIYATAVTRTLVETAGHVSNQRDTVQSYEAVVRSYAQATKSAFPGAWKNAPPGKNRHVPRPWVDVKPYEWFQVGAFRAQSIPIDHSVPGACFFVVEGGDGKRVLYTGDFRFHGVYAHASAEAKRRLEGLKPDALLCEGTRIDSDHQDSEEDVLRTTTDTLRGTKGLAFVEWGWKDATRFLTVQKAALAAKRTLLVDPRVAYTHARLAAVDPSYRPISDYPNVRVYQRRKGTLTYSPEDYDEHELGLSADWDDDAEERVRAWFASEDGGPAPPEMTHWENGVRADAVRADPQKYVVQTSYFQMNELFDLDPPKGSYYIRSACEPFNDEMLTDQRKLLNWLGSWGVGSNVQDDLHGHHTSGHASGSELAAFFKSVSPKTLFPIHTLHPGRFSERWPAGNVQVPRYLETVRV